MKSRRLQDLHPFVHEKAAALIQAAAEKGIVLLVTTTYRSISYQDELYAHGRTRPGKIVTNAPGGSSAHNYGLAFDVVPLDENRKPWWDPPQYVWAKLYKLGERCGLDALGDPWGEYLAFDKGHFQEPGWSLVKERAFQWIRAEGKPV